MKNKLMNIAFWTAVFLSVSLTAPSFDSGFGGASAGERLRHEILYEKYKNAPAGSDEKEEYYKQYSAAYSEYIKNGGKTEKTSYSYKADENKDGATSAELYARYKKEGDPEKKQELYDDYIKTYKKERSQAGNTGYDKNSGRVSKDDKNLSGADKNGRKTETLADVKARTDRAYEKYKNAPSDSEEKERYYREYQRAYQQYRAKLEEKPAGGELAGKQAPPYFAATGGYIADTPNTPVPAVSGGGGGGNVFKKLFRKAEQSTEKLIGAQTTAALELLYGVDKDPAMNARLNRVAERIAAVSDRRDLSYKFKILNMKEVNAFAVPGGAIYVTSEMMNFLSSDSELAFVLGHEMGHQVGRHSIKALEKAMLIDFFIRNSKIGVIENNQKALEIANAFLSLQYSRANEFESDRYGFKYATMTGYNPYASVSFFDKLKNKYEKEKTPAFLRLFQTHPSTHDRLVEAQNMAVGYSAVNPQWQQMAPKSK